MEEGDYIRTKSFLILLLVLSLTAQLFLLGYLNEETTITANAVTSGKVSICIGLIPEINFSKCNNSALQDEFYECQLELKNLNISNVTYSSSFTYINRYFNDSEEDLFSVSESGYFSFAPENDDVGNYTISFFVSSPNSCDGVSNYNSWNFNVINVNDAPVFSGELDDLILSKGQKFYGFYLSNYFSDPDLDLLLYDITGNNKVNIDSGAFYFKENPNPLNNQVIFYSDSCGVTETVYFTAIDPYNATSKSNSFTITVNCEEESNIPSSSPSGGGGRGGDSGTETFKPLDSRFSHFKREECTENWDCDEWSECYPNGTMTRECRDLRRCGTIKYRPDLVQECIYGGTCFDGIKNCHNGSCEENIDCGGPCAPCKIKDTSTSELRSRTQKIIPYILGSLALSLMILGIYLRKLIINQFYKALAFLFIKKKQKQILLSEKEKDELLEDIRLLEKDIPEKNVAVLVEDYGKILKNYINYSCGKSLTGEFDLDELKTRLKENEKNNTKNSKGKKSKIKLIRKEIKKLLIDMYEEYEFFESNKKLNKKDIKLLSESLRTLVIHTSEIKPKDLDREHVELKIKKDMSKEDSIKIEIINVYIALEFLKMEIVQEKYNKIIRLYEKLTPVQKVNIDYELKSLNSSMEYIKSWHL